MTQQQFDNYKFSSKTEVKNNVIWYKILSVDFETGYIETEDFRVYYRGVKDIRN